MAILKKGLSGEPVRRLQTKLAIEADGAFGLNTEKALKDWQTKNSLTSDGVAGPDTFMAMGLYELVLLKQGTRGETVKKLQEKLGIDADAQFGSSTEKAVREYQQKNGLVIDGMAGPATLAHMKLFKEITADTVRSSQVAASHDTDAIVAPTTVAANTGSGVRSIWDTIKSVLK
jgi:peptidoglycan hydrolase-like protein with peptidoglycan-binding domain